MPQALDASLRLARGRGTISVVGAHFEFDYPLDNAPCSRRSSRSASHDRRPGARPGAAAGLVAAGRLDPTPVITHRLALADAAEGYRLSDEREATKVVLLL